MSAKNKKEAQTVEKKLDTKAVKCKKEEEKPEVNCICLARAAGAPDACPPVRNITHPLRYYEFTQDEIKVLEECDRESFYRRCVPFSTLFATITYAAIKYGILSRNPHFGTYPKVLMAILFGHVAGRVSFLADCEVKLRQLPEYSYLGQVMRKHCLDRNPPQPPPLKSEGQKG